MEPSDRAASALRRARYAYERTHLVAGMRGVAVAAALAALAVGLHATSSTTWLIAGMLATSLAVLGWRGGAWRRGALAGVLAGLPPLIVPSIVFALSYGGHCPSCEHTAALPCMIACFGTSSLVGAFVGTRAAADPAPRRFAVAAIAAAALTGLLGCGTIGLGGALGIVVGLVAGGLTGWVVAARSAHA
ncbi:MAG TPA: hypothetical protein VLM79_17365 [Kofleriaceae bacterium]|nr:hypothetical protein [Kofleriaceae bacterium]